jgi:hypothetical protein
MEACCEPTPDRERVCPACGRMGRGVDRITVAAMLRPAALARLGEAEHRYCATPDCPVVYFAGADLFRSEEIGVAVFHKEPSGARTVCYCFAITEGDVGQELAVSGRSTVVERISALVAAGQCACEVKNPQGNCCLGNFAAVVRSAQVGAATPSGSMTGTSR